MKHKLVQNINYSDLVVSPQQRLNIIVVESVHIVTRPVPLNAFAN